MPTRPRRTKPTPEGYAKRVAERKELGLTFIKFDIRPDLFGDVRGRPVGQPSAVRVRLWPSAGARRARGPAPA